MTATKQTDFSSVKNKSLCTLKVTPLQEWGRLTTSTSVPSTTLKCNKSTRQTTRFKNCSSRVKKYRKSAVSKIKAKFHNLSTPAVNLLRCSMLIILCVLKRIKFTPMLLLLIKIPLSLILRIIFIKESPESHSIHLQISLINILMCMNLQITTQLRIIMRNLKIIRSSHWGTFARRKRKKWKTWKRKLLKWLLCTWNLSKN